MARHNEKAPGANGAAAQEEGLVFFPIPLEKIPEHRARQIVEAAKGEQAARALRVERKAREERQKAQEAAMWSHDLSAIITGWGRMKEHGDEKVLTRETMRRIDMHVALTDPEVLDSVRRGNADAADLLDTLDQTTPGSITEPDNTPLFAEGESPFDFLRSVSTHSDLVEPDANLRTKREHARMRFSIEVATHTSSLANFLHILDSQIGREHAKQLTGLERATLHDQLEHLLQSKDWPHPTQEIAESFAFWEHAIGHASLDRYTYQTVRADFKPEEAAPAPPARPSFWQNLMNVPSDLGKVIFNEDGARTGKPKK